MSFAWSNTSTRHKTIVTKVECLRKLRILISRYLFLTPRQLQITKPSSMFGCAGSCQGFCLDTKSRHPSPNTTLPAKRSFPLSSLPDTYCNINSLCATIDTALRPSPDSIPPAIRSSPLWIPAAAPSEGLRRRASAAVPTQRTAVASRRGS